MWLALREIVHNRRFSTAYVINLSLGLFGFLLLNSFNLSVQKNFQIQSRSLLTADLAVSSRRAMSDEEETLIHQATRTAISSTRTIELYSMISTSKGSRLAELIAIEDLYPLYGEIQLEHSGEIRSGRSQVLTTQPFIWISPQLSLQMTLNPNDTVKIGNAEFQVQDRIEKDSGAGWQGFSLAPRLYIGLSQLQKTGLVRPGSTLQYRRFFKFDSESRLEQASTELNLLLKDPGIQITTHRKAGEQMGRVMSYLSDYLGLVALVGLFLAALGSTYLFHSFLSRRFGEIAILISLGLSHFKAIQIYLVQMILLGLASFLLATGASLMALPLAGQVLARYLAFSFQLRLSFLSLLSTLLVGLGASLLISIPLILRIRSLKPALVS